MTTGKTIALTRQSRKCNRSASVLCKSKLKAVIDVGRLCPHLDFLDHLRTRMVCSQSVPALPFVNAVTFSSLWTFLPYNRVIDASFLELIWMNQFMWNHIVWRGLMIPMILVVPSKTQNYSVLTAVCKTWERLLARDIWNRFSKCLLSPSLLSQEGQALLLSCCCRADETDA